MSDPTTIGFTVCADSVGWGVDPWGTNFLGWGDPVGFQGRGSPTVVEFTTCSSLPVPPPPATSFLLLEDGFFMLLEEGGEIALENQ